MQLDAALKALQLRAWSHATTLRLARIVDNREAAFNTASGILMEFGRRAVIATAWHVVQELVRMRAEGHEVYLICDNMLIVHPQVAWRDEVSDVVLLEVPEAGRDRLDAVPYRPGSRLWPPPRVNAGDAVLLCGFPKLFRLDEDEILHGDLNLLVDVASASDSYFMLQIETAQLVQAGRVPVDVEADFAGASGGPVFLSDNGGNPLVGVVSEAGNTLPLWRIASLASVPSDIESLPSQPLFGGEQPR